MTAKFKHHRRFPLAPDDPESKKWWDVLTFSHNLPGRCRGKALLVSNIDDQTCPTLRRPS